MRRLISILLVVPLTIGALVGFVVAPFVVGFLASYEFIADHVDGAHLRMEAKRSAKP